MNPSHRKQTHRRQLQLVLGKAVETLSSVRGPKLQDGWSNCTYTCSPLSGLPSLEAISLESVLSRTRAVLRHVSAWGSHGAVRCKQRKWDAVKRGSQGYEVMASESIQDKRAVVKGNQVKAGFCWRLHLLTVLSQCSTPEWA